MNKTQPSGQDLEQQLNNILDFVTQPTSHSAENKSDVSEQTTLNKALGEHFIPPMSSIVITPVQPIPAGNYRGIVQ